MREKLEAWVRKRFVEMHGEGAEKQYDFYRCYTCGSLVTWNMIKGNKLCCLRRVVPSGPKWYEWVWVFFMRS